MTTEPCKSCDGRGWVSGGKVSHGWHVPASCRDCKSAGVVELGHLYTSTHPKLPLGQDIEFLKSFKSRAGRIDD